ncbi:MAG: protoheme IX farnesyltransferase [Chlamydiae bacterium]|nr:protoheme IX farnesyltransferase [Chlamydiota bacterium]
MEKIVRQYAVLVKPGIVVGNLLTMIAGFATASQGRWDFPLFIWTLFGLSCVIMSGCIWNNFIDREIDEKMERTKNRPLVTKQIPLFKAQLLGAILSVIGFFALFLGTNIMAAFTAIFGLTIYVFAYSFGKYRFSESTLIGAIAGATPPVVGYSAVSGRVDFVAFLLFLLVVFWQMPHFFAIAIYRFHDYAKASIPLLPIKEGIFITKVAMLVYLVGYALVCMILAPYVLILNIAWIAFAIYGFFLKGQNKVDSIPSIEDIQWAKKMFFFSLAAVLFTSTSLVISSFL